MTRQENPTRQVETSALVQSTPYPKPRQQLISRTPKKSPLPFLVRQLIIKQELPRNKYQDHVNNSKTILIYHVGLFTFLFIITSTQLHREFIMTTLGQRWSSAPTIIHGVEYLIFVFLIFGLLRLWYVSYQWKKEENRIAEIKAKIEKELDEGTDAPIINPVTNGSTNQASRLTHDLGRTLNSTIIPDATVPATGTATGSTGLHTSGTNMQSAPFANGTTTGLHTSSTNMQSVPFAPNAWLRDGSPIQVKVPHAKYRTTTFATPMTTNERSVSIKKRVHGGMPPDPDPDEGIEY
ncbi:8954_t:CDS:2 [Cetraspora pellucida]|uniref:8954_t:CDS:1 n=1 Tax=Cetraspora pellucida TaxID=1433469 RepID=A0ACA9LNK8_9GLOM|nr:8954_t:CDS:2 [Cetraspora pellucida]